MWPKAHTGQLSPPAAGGGDGAGADSAGGAGGGGKQGFAIEGFLLDYQSHCLGEAC